MAFDEGTKRLMSGKACAQSLQAGGEPVTAQHRHLEFVHPGPKICWCESAGGKRMFQKGQHRHRREIFGDNGDKALQESAGLTACQWPSRRVINVDVPALQRRNYRLCQLPVRRDEGGGPPRGLEHLAHGEGDGSGFLGAGRTFDD